MWQKKANKYGATRASYNGHMYHSAMERDDAMWLHQLERDGEISELKEQVRYRIFHNGEHIVDSIVDFAFLHNGKQIYYEVKGMSTDKYRVVRKLIEADLKESADTFYIVNSIDLQQHMRGCLTRK